MAQLLAPFAGARANRVAQALLARFGSLARALSADEKQLAAALGQDHDIGQLIAAARTLILAGLRESVTREAVDPQSSAFRTYLAAKYRGKLHEELFAIFVDGTMGFLSEDLVSIGDGARIETRISPILRRALELGAAGYYLVHNHPSCQPDPSGDDIQATRRAETASNAVGIQLFDHLIVAGNRISSMRALGLL